MTVAYSVLTAKGQITLPAEMRHRLGLSPGTRLAIRETGDHIAIEVPAGIERVRERLKAEAQAAGTWNQPFDPADGWADAAADKLVTGHA
ncbi:MAG: AbrB/MazE/SpoVT family DNA-binding domain-containing protein [Bifidobacteriaceae bacterium]|jgi:AbrB family looped-hinge helix DNA binding protein|nr:AbrB/MazE/SpoVT family DNA-binding domain-containing protein [Bifidobacteriaceae bacterium]